MPDEVVETIAWMRSCDELAVDRRLLLLSLLGLLGLYLAGATAAGRLALRRRVLTWLLAGLTLVPAALLVWQRGWSLRSLGLTIGHSESAISESLVLAALVMGLSLLAKTALSKPNTTLIRMPDAYACLYLLLAAFQELLFRGILQGVLCGSLAGAQRSLWAIGLSATIFGLVHLHYSWPVALASGLLGLALGFLYARHGTLIGVALAHGVMGVWIMNALGGRELLCGSEASGCGQSLTYDVNFLPR